MLHKSRLGYKSTLYGSASLLVRHLNYLITKRSTGLYEAIISSGSKAAFSAVVAVICTPQIFL